ncbi:MAG TPA: bifunctional UDP-N-acetylglucosamine diphosphorylase/glucosamine-1-phosphate N-acetyltransferase GlmU [Thermoanaerobaculia bacterium]
MAKKKTGSPKGAAPEAPPRVVVLAAGVGSRMRSSLPKVLHRVAGRTLIEAVLDAVAGLTPSQTVVVLGPRREHIEAVLEGRGVTVVVQDPPRGTGDAVSRALPALAGGDGPIVVVAGDTPLLTPATLRALVARRAERRLDAVLLSFRPPEPGDFGRVVRDRRGRVARIVEAAHAGARERRLGEVNAGAYCFDFAALSRALSALAPNRGSGELYLTDAIAALAKGRGGVDAVVAEDWREAWGVNTRRDLAAAEEIERRRGVERALDAGVTLVDASTVRIGPHVTLAPDVIVHPFVSLEGTTSLAEETEILPFSRVADSRIGRACRIGPHTDVEGARIGARARVGPFARIRPETVLADDVRVGNFVETKKAVLGAGVKANHLAYLGDAEIGAGANIGAGVITCNYDGEKKHKTVIGEGAFVGSDSQLVAPVTVGPGAYVGSGTTVTKNVPAGALAISRTPQKVVEGWAAKRKARKQT